jgi:SAM-dependent methyltransferase
VTEKFILDATAGFRRMWFNKKHPNTVYLDSRPEVKPDVIGDFRKMRFDSETFRLVVFDPPHQIGYPSNPDSDFVKDFGYLVPETWMFDLGRGLEECWRVLKPYGVLIFKWNTKYQNLRTVKSLFPDRPLFGQVTKGNRTGRKDESQTFWFCFMKIPGRSRND